MKKVLLIVAAGKSSRFGGYPKAFCMMGNRMNVENTIEKAKSVFDDIYVGLNIETVEQYKDLKLDAHILKINTGQGDSMSMLKLIRLIREENRDLDRIYVCWGDAFFVDEQPFEQFSFQIKNDDFYVACSIDERPYAWFDVDGSDNIITSHFKKNDGEIEKGIHDQSLFCFNIDKYIEYITEFREYLGVQSEDYDPDEPKEVKVLDLFTYLYKKGVGVKTVLINRDKVLSFNTREELDKIVEDYC